MTDRRRKLPDPNAAHALAVCAGQEKIGSVVRVDDQWFAFDAAGKFLGISDTAIEAAKRIPTAGRHEAGS
jgi:hypothetical protein